MKRFASVLLLLALLLSLCACGQTTETEPKTTTETTTETSTDTTTETAAETIPETIPETTEETASAVDAELGVNVMVLNGTTGFGMARLMADAQTGEAALNYRFAVESDASAVTAALISGDCDIAALPTNAAATVYNKTEGGVKMLAINTLGVLYLVVNGETVAVDSLDDLAGMTVYAPAQNPTFLLRALLDAAGVENVTVDNSYAQPADLRTALAAGEVDIAVLPEPMVTIARAANDKLTTALDLTAEWDRVQSEGSLVQGCVVARTEFAAAHPAEIAAFLQEYEASIAYLSEDAEAAGALIEQTGVFTNGTVAAKAIPNCNVCFVTGEAMQAAMDSFCNILFALEPAAVGGAVPNADFYWLG